MVMDFSTLCQTPLLVDSSFSFKLRLKGVMLDQVDGARATQSLEQQEVVTTTLVASVTVGLR